ncbi:MAG: Bug family tripartite tricarboxylate transporter substrate binding protein [Pseudolabrys sp.]
MRGLRIATLRNLALMSAAAILAASGPGHAEDKYPSRAVHIVAAAAPGGNPDVLARLLADRLSNALGSPFVVENMAGAGGVLAAKRIADAKPDGYTLMINDSGALAISVAMNPQVKYTLKDFTPVTSLASVPTALVVIPNLPANNLQEFIALAKSKPGELSFGSAGAGSIHHLTMEIFEERTGIKLLHVPYKGGTALVAGLLGKEIQAGWSGLPNVVPHIKSGTLRAMCVSVLQRAKSLPDVPTCDELGIKGFDVADMLGLQGPAGLPPEVVRTLQQAVAKAVRDPAFAEKLALLGMNITEDGTANYAAFMKDDMDRYGKIVDRLHLRQAQ